MQIKRECAMRHGFWSAVFKRAHFALRPHGLRHSTILPRFYDFDAFLRKNKPQRVADKQNSGNALFKTRICFSISRISKSST